MLKNRIAIVTGGNRGLGAVIAQRFRDEGASVFAFGRRDVNVCIPSQIDAFVASVVGQMGRIDVLVNNAAILGPVGPVETNSWHDWQNAIDTNLLGAVYFTRAVLPHMKTQRFGKIINIAGGGASDPLPRRSAYATSKAALVRFSECVAEEVREFCIDVNAVAPGPMATDMLDEIIEAGPGQLGEMEYAHHTRIRDEGGTSPELAARLCAYLASDASNGISGRMIAARYDAWPFSDALRQKLSPGSDLYTLRRVREAV